jgi:HEAT repeat protein
MRRHNGLLLFGLCLVLSGCADEPLFEGRPVAHWRQQLKKPDYMARWRACHAFNFFGHSGKEAIPDLIECLHDNEHLVRFEAASALGTMGEEARAAVPDLVPMLKDGQRYVRDAASAALKKIDPATWATVAKESGEEL